jgi:hypothetical protein
MICTVRRIQIEKKSYWNLIFNFNIQIKNLNKQKKKKKNIITIDFNKLDIRTKTTAI